MGADLRFFRKNRQISRFFEGEKSLNMGSLRASVKDRKQKLHK